MGAYSGPNIRKVSNIEFGVDFASDKVVIDENSVQNVFGDQTLTLVNSPDLINTESKITRRGMSFEGTSSRIQLSQPISLQPPWTSTAVFKILNTTATTAFRSTIFGVPNTSVPGFYRVYNDVRADDGAVRVRILTRYLNPTGTWSSFSSYVGPYGSSYVSAALQDEFWVDNILHLTTTMSSNLVLRVYLNGVLRHTQTRTTSGDQDLGFYFDRLGVRSTSSESLTGIIYRAFLYNTEFSPDAIQQNFIAMRNRFFE